MYFRLNPECYLIKGKKLGMIFDLIDATIYTLNTQETEVVAYCENNNPIETDNEVIKELWKLRLGNYYNNKIYIPKLRIGNREDRHDPLNPMDPPDFHRAFLEINNVCNRDCWFCGYHGIRRSMGCMGCNKWKENEGTLSVEKWKNTIDGLRDLRCNEIYLTGGDLTLSWDKTLEILDHARDQIRAIHITLHQESLSSDKLEDLPKDIKIITQSTKPIKMNYKNLYTLLTVRPSDSAYISSNEKNVILDYIIEEKTCLQINHAMMSKSKIIPVNMHRFLDNIEFHPCLGHTLAICYNGDIAPCRMMRNHTFGNIRTKEIYTIFETEWERILKFWKLNLDKIERCTCCEFRYTCSDCRALEEALTGKLNGKLLCNYHPAEGEWR